jgi:hypothetical protein
MRLDLMELGFKCGWRPTYRGSWSSAPEKGRRPIHHIHLLRSHIGWSGGKQRQVWQSEVAEPGTEVWCPSVPNGNFYVMQNGVCWWTGNSQEKASLLPTEYRRVHENRWGTSTDPFLDEMAWYDACKQDLPPLRPDQSLVVALDAAVSGDCFAIVAVSREGDVLQKRACRIWTPPPGGKIRYSNPEDKDDLDTPEGFVRWLAKTYPVLEFAYDEYQLHDFATRLAGDGVGWFRVFNQGKERLVADKHLYDIIRARTFAHDGDPHLRRHVQNANRVPEGEKKENLRIVKRASSLPIDACVALSMACREARRLNMM